MSKPKTSAIILATLVLLSPGWSPGADTVVVRDQTGKVIEKRITRGKRTEVRSPTGKLIRVEIKKKGRIEVRSPTGRLIRTEKRVRK